jgi:hypothetical protein
MPNPRTTRLWRAIGSLVIAAMIVAPVLLAQKAQLAKICPLTIGIDPNSVLVKHLATKLEADNALLAAFLIQVRQRVSADKSPQPVKILGPALTPGSFAGTYLADPTLTKPDGSTINHWDQIVSYLTGPGGAIVESTYLDVQSVSVTLEYIPGDAGNDFQAHIRTVLAYAPYDDPVTLNGGLIHCKICEWATMCPPPGRGNN